MKTALKDRTLWYDGDSVVTEQQLLNIILGQGASPSELNLYVDKMTPSISQFNSLKSADEQIRTKNVLKALDFDWNLPEQYKEELYPDEQVEEKIRQDCVFRNAASGLTEAEWQIRYERIEQELKLYKQLNLYNVLRTMMYIVDTLTLHNVVWGVGRGSSVSSYVLYVMRVHDVDSVKYGLNIEDFLKV